MPVESTLAVRNVAGLVELPMPRSDIVGVLPGDPPLSVSCALGAGGDQVLVVVAKDDVRYGLQVLEVLGVRRFDDHQIGPPPPGQHGGLVAGTICGADDHLVLVADAQALAARL